jgi:hypothetical protein
MNLIKTNNILTITSTPSAGQEAILFIQKMLEDSEELLYTHIGESTSYILTEDGYFKVTELLVSNTNQGNYYITNGITYNSLDAEVSPEELLENVIANDSSNIINAHFITDYYKDILKSGFLKCLCKNSNKQIMDTITMGLFLIEYLEQESLYYECARILKSLKTCNYVANLNCNCYG